MSATSLSCFRRSKKSLGQPFGDCNSACRSRGRFGPRRCPSNACRTRLSLAAWLRDGATAKELPTLGELRVFRAETQPPPGVPRQAMAVTIELLRSGSPPDLQPSRAPFNRTSPRLYSVNNLDAKEILFDRDALLFQDSRAEVPVDRRRFSRPAGDSVCERTSSPTRAAEDPASRRICGSFSAIPSIVPTSLRDVWLKQQIVEDIHGVRRTSGRVHESL